MAGINNVNVSGRLGAVPDLEVIGEYHKLSFSLAIENRAKKDGQWIDRPVWMNIDYWVKENSSGYYFQHMEQGRKVFVSGKLQCDEWIDKATQLRRKKYYIKALAIDFQPIEAPAEIEEKTSTSNNVDFDEDMPF